MITFSEPLDDSSINPGIFRIIAAGRDKRFDSPGQPSGDNRTVWSGVPDYDQSVDPTTAVITSTVTINVSRGMQKDTFYQLMIDGSGMPSLPTSVVGLNRNVLDGEFAAAFPSGNGVDGGDFIALVALGNKFTYPDRSGDRVSLSLSGPGVMEMVSESPTTDGVRAEAATLRLTGTTRHSNLTGRVKPAGTTSIARVTGLLGVRNNIQNNPSFALGQVSALVVDRVLGSHQSAHGRFDDLVEDLLRGRDKLIAVQFSI